MTRTFQTMKGLLHAGGKKFSADSNEMAILALIYVGMHHPVGAVADYAEKYYTRQKLLKVVVEALILQSKVPC